jgi:hypothetical protein
LGALTVTKSTTALHPNSFSFGSLATNSHE